MKEQSLTLQVTNNVSGVCTASQLTAATAAGCWNEVVLEVASNPQPCYDSMSSAVVLPPHPQTEDLCAPKST